MIARNTCMVNSDNTCSMKQKKRTNLKRTKETIDFQLTKIKNKQKTMAKWNQEKKKEKGHNSN